MADNPEQLLANAMHAAWQVLTHPDATAQQRRDAQVIVTVLMAPDFFVLPNGKVGAWDTEYAADFERVPVITNIVTARKERGPHDGKVQPRPHV